MRSDRATVCAAPSCVAVTADGAFGEGRLSLLEAPDSNIAGLEWKKGNLSRGVT